MEDVRALMMAVRHSDVVAAGRLLAEGVDVNAKTQVEPIIARPQELPLYDSHPLFEACRGRNVDLIQLLLRQPDIDVNARATRLELTAFCDACSRNDIMVAQLLLADPRVDGRIGSTVVANAVLYVCMTGALPLLKLCADHGLLDDDVEASAVATAAANGGCQAVRNCI
jgi:hypothetical protein